MDKSKLKELILSNILNFLLIGLLTVILSSYFNRKISDIGLEFEETQYDRQSAERVFERISEVMNTRLFRMRRLILHYQDPQYPQQAEKLRTQYGDALDNWNSNLSTNVNLIGLRFGKNAEDQFKGIHDEFRNLQIRFESVVRKKQGLDQQDLKQSTDYAPEFNRQLGDLNLALQHISEKIDQINLAMVEAIQNGKVGRNRLK